MSIKVVEVNENNELDEMVNELNKSDTEIKYILDIATKEEDGYNTIERDDINNYDFKHKSFIEVLLKPYYIHPYYDFDGYDDKKPSHLKNPAAHIQNEKEYIEAIEFINNESIKLGKYSLCGYTKSEELAKLSKLRLNKANNHYCSFHVVFYETKVKSTDWIKHIKLMMKKCRFIDDDVYKLKSRQLFRHGLSNKITAGKLEHSKGQILGDLPPETQIITIRGDETYIKLDDEIKEIGQHKQKEIKEIKDDLTGLIDAVEYNNNEPLIIVNHAELLEMLNEFEPRYSASVETKINCVFTAPAIMNDTIESALLTWYNQVKHENGDKPIKEWLKRYRVPNENNSWFYTLLKHMENRTKAEEFKRRFKIIECVETEINQVKDLEYIRLVDLKKYNRLNDKLGMLKRCILYMFNLKCWFSRLEHDTIDIIKPSEIDDKLKACGIYKLKDRNEIKEALYTNVAIDENINFDSLFVGWKYEKCDKSENYDINIKDFKECVLLNICSNDEDLFNYLLYRISFILHNPGILSKVCVVYQGLEGTGKNWFCDIICEIFYRYSSKNTNLNKLTARFNAPEVIGRCYVVCNEALDADGFYSMSEEMKKIIERPEINAEKKGLDSINIKNALNVDITSNNSKPVLISPSDRRYLNIRTNPIHADEKEYWKYYQEEVIKRDGFYSDIYNMIYNDYFNENFLSLPIPDTKAKLRLMKICCNTIDRYIIKNLEKFDLGVTAREIKNDYKNLSKEDRGNYGENRFLAEVINKCIEIEDKRNKCIRYKPTEKMIDRYCDIANVDDDDDDDENNDDDEDIKQDEDLNASYDAWINENKHELNNIYYIFSSEIKDVEIKKYMISKGWEYSKCINRSKINKCGYKLLEHEEK